MRGTLDMVRAFREADQDTPIVLMGYYNPIYVYPVDAFLAEAKAAGVDGLIIVDVPPEADDELCLPALAGGLNFIRLATPTTDAKRLPAVLANTSGFVYYVSIAGITGTKAPDPSVVHAHVARIKAANGLARGGRLRRSRCRSGSRHRSRRRRGGCRLGAGFGHQRQPRRGRPRHRWYGCGGSQDLLSISPKG